MNTVDLRDEFEAERAELGAIIRAGNATPAQLRKHRLLTQYWSGPIVDPATLKRELERAR